jgi:hypothetical protein
MSEEIKKDAKVVKPSVDGEIKQPANQEPPAKTSEQLMMEILVKDAAERAVEAEERRENIRRKAAARQSASSEQESARFNRQAKCAHLKGGAHRSYKAAKDYAVYRHKFIDGSERIKCFLCSMEVRNGSVSRGIPADTRDFIYREHSGVIKKFPNPTRLSWDDALELANQSSNKFSSSEIPTAQTQPAAEATVVANLQDQLAKLQAQVDSQNK